MNEFGNFGRSHFNIYDLCVFLGEETDSRNFDATLLHKLISRYCGLAPRKDWFSEPSQKDETKGANFIRLYIGKRLVLLYLLRNKTLNSYLNTNPILTV